MVKQKLCAFSPCGELFVCVNDAGTLSLWETATNNVKQEFDVQLHLKTVCSSIIWATFQTTTFENEDNGKDKQFIVIGTKAGEIYMYDYNLGKLYNHFNSGHNSDVNDLSLHYETNRLFSCSSDKSVIIWDTNSGKITDQWIADDKEIYSISVVDNNNLLTGSTSIIWWNIKDKSVIKKFQCQEVPITILKVVNSLDVSSSSYFLSASMGASKISAWPLNKKKCSNAVASFVVNGEPQSLDNSKNFSKDNPLLLTAVTKTGNLVLYKHVLNGKTKDLVPEMTIEIVSNPIRGELITSKIPILSSKILDCAESCIIAYGNDDCPIFESVNTFDYPKKLILARSKKLQKKVYDYFVPKVKLAKKHNENELTNGKSFNDLSYNSPKRRKVVHANSATETSPTDCIRNMKKVCLDNRLLLNSSPTVKKKQKLSIKLERPKTPESDTEGIVVPSDSSEVVDPLTRGVKDRNSPIINDRPKTPESDTEGIIVPTDPSEIIDTLLRGIEEKNSSIIKSVLKCDDSELIKASVKNLPRPRLNVVLLELYKQLKLQNKRYNSNLRHWLKEILSYHLPYLITCEDLKEILNKVSELIDIRYITQTLARMRMLKGLLQVQKKQNISSDSSESNYNDSSCNESNFNESSSSENSSSESSSSESDIEELVDS